MKTHHLGTMLLCLIALSACVTQQYVDEDKKPLVQNEATHNEIAMTRISLGIGYLNIGNTQQAKFNLEKAKQYAPKLVQVHTAFAHYYDTVGETEQAITAYEKALSLKKDDADTLNNYGVFLCKQGRLEKAEQQFLKAIAVPSYTLVSESYENLGICHLKSNNFKDAESYLEKAITHSPSRASSLLQMANLQYAKNNYQRSLAFFKRYETSTRRFTASSLAFSYRLHQGLRDRKKAQSYASMLLKMFPNSYEAKQYLLNNLVEIEADKLANEYKTYYEKKHPKRVVKLTPKSSKIRSKYSIDESKALEVIKDNGIKQEKLIVSTSNEIKQSTVISRENHNEIEIKKTHDDNRVIKEKEANVTANNNNISLPTHTVIKSEGLFNISRQYNIQMRSILAWNNLNASSIIREGDIIYLADPKQVSGNE